MSTEPQEDAPVAMRQTSYPKQYARPIDDAAPLGPSYGDIAAEIACLEHNAATHQDNRDRYDAKTVER